MTNGNPGYPGCIWRAHPGSVESLAAHHWIWEPRQCAPRSGL